MTYLKRMSPDLLGGRQVDELVRSPALVKALGIDLGGYYRNQKNLEEDMGQQ